MNTRIFTAILLSAMTASAMAQETYENATIADNDLNGTARYVGMGGAMEALGSDISTISSNPAGIGTFRSSQVTVSGGLQITNGSSALTKLQNANDYARQLPNSSTSASFDQIGVVLSMKEGYGSFLNIAFNYHKSKNFNQILTAANSLSNASQNKLSYLKGDLGIFAYDDINENYVDAAYYDCFLVRNDGYYWYENADHYDFARTSEGYIGNYDMNISGNINNTVYLGLTMGVKDVHYNSSSFYTENLVAGSNFALRDNRQITGQGFDVKLGVIYRPFTYSGFRVGAYVSTPTFYKLTTRNYTQMDCTVEGDYRGNYYNGSYDFQLNTPWIFGASLGHTIGNNIALGLTYEYSDYAYLDSRISEDGGDYSTSYSDNIMNANTKECLKGTHTLKAGVEYRPIPELAIRAGYNFVSPKFNQSGYKDGTLESNGVYQSSQTDYTNWKSTNRFTLGLGYSKGKYSIDLAYQYSQRNGKFCPFMTYDGDDNAEFNNVSTLTSVSEKRHNLLMTLGYKF